MDAPNATIRRYKMTMMDDLVNTLAELQAEVKGYEHEADYISFQIDDQIAATEKELSDLIEERKTIRRPFTVMAEEAQTTIEDTKKYIIYEWDGDKKTLKYDAGTLKFRTAKGLEIHNNGVMLHSLLRHFSTKEVADHYISGFNKTAVRKFIDLHPLDIATVELISSTTVKLQHSRTTSNRLSGCLIASRPLSRNTDISGGREMGYEKEILAFVHDHPGCDSEQLIEGLGYPNAASEAGQLVLDQKLDRWYSMMMPHYYIPGTYNPQYCGGDE